MMHCPARWAGLRSRRPGPGNYDNVTLPGRLSHSEERIVRYFEHRRRVVASIAVATAAAAATAVGVSVAVAAASGCRVTYTVTNEWQGGFGANVDVTNLGDPVNGWA